MARFTALTIIYLTLFCGRGFTQDLLGLKATQIKRATRHLSGVKWKRSGDTLIYVDNVKLGRRFEFKIDERSKVCFEVNMQLLENVKNIGIVDRFYEYHDAVLKTSTDDSKTYETKQKQIDIIHAKGIVAIRLKLTHFNSEWASDDRLSQNQLMSSL